MFINNDFLHQKESEALHKREVQLRKRERALRDAEKLSHTTDIIIDKVVTREVENRCQAVVEVKLLWYLILILSINLKHLRYHLCICLPTSSSFTSGLFRACIVHVLYQQNTSYYQIWFRA